MVPSSAYHLNHGCTPASFRCHIAALRHAVIRISEKIDNCQLHRIDYQILQSCDRTLHLKSGQHVPNELQPLRVCLVNPMCFFHRITSRPLSFSLRQTEWDKLASRQGKFPSKCIVTKLMHWEPASYLERTRPNGCFVAALVVTWRPILKSKSVCPIMF